MNCPRSDDDSDSGDEFDDDDVAESPDDDSLVSCPYCRRQIYEDAQRCPYCERYISDEDRPAALPKWWLLVGVALALLAVVGWFVR